MIGSSKKANRSKPICHDSGFSPPVRKGNNIDKVKRSESALDVFQNISHFRRSDATAVGASSPLGETSSLLADSLDDDLLRVLADDHLHSTRIRAWATHRNGLRCVTPVSSTGLKEGLMEKMGRVG